MAEAKSKKRKTPEDGDDLDVKHAPKRACQGPDASTTEEVSDKKSSSSSTDIDDVDWVTVVPSASVPEGLLALPEPKSDLPEDAEPEPPTSAVGFGSQQTLQEMDAVLAEHHAAGRTSERRLPMEVTLDRDTLHKINSSVEGPYPHNYVATFSVACSPVITAWPWLMYGKHDYDG